MKRRLIEHYEVTRKLGAGGSGVVYLANDTLLMRPVVLKILKRGSLTIEQMRSTVLREARLASAIEHPNVCAIYEVGESEDEAYIVMQYVPGESLDKIIANGAASVQLGLSVGIQIADGLSAAHRLGIFHRDLKPANVMLTDGGVVKILDFGLARRLSAAEAEFDPSKPRQDASKKEVRTTYTARGGTIAYMAPEQFVTGQTSVQSDIFAVGVTLYELLSGRHPFARAGGGRASDRACDSICRSAAFDRGACRAGERDRYLFEQDTQRALFLGRRSSRSLEDHHEDDAIRDRHSTRRNGNQSARACG